jgi:hypothetical protein
VGVDFEKVAAEFERARTYIVGDARRIVAQPVGGNYAIALLVSVGYETLADWRYGHKQGERVFADTLPDSLRSTAPALYGAMRDGLAHAGYETKVITVGTERVEVTISWRERAHLSVGEGCVFLNACTLVSDLETAFRRYEDELRASPDTRQQFWDRARRGSPQQVGGEAQMDAWRRLLAGDR